MKRVFRLAGLRRVLADVDAELAFHFEMTMRELMNHGHSEEHARREAARRFGDVDATRARLTRIDRQHDRQLRRADWWEGVGQDVRFAARALRRSPGLTAGIVLTLALGIGANAAMFGIVDRLLLRGPDHVVASEQLRRVYFTTPGPTKIDETTSYVGYVTYTLMRDHTRAFERVAGYTRPYPSVVGRGSDAHRLAGSSVTWDFFPLTGVRPVIGRFFTADEDRPSSAVKVVVIGEGTWQQYFGADTGVLGKSLTIDGSPFTVIGVAPAGFSGVELEPVDFWIPMSVVGPTRSSDWATTFSMQWLQVVARVRPGVDEAQAGKEATLAYRRAYTGQEKLDSAARLTLSSIAFTARGREASEARVSRWLVSVAIVVLLVACANVTNLLLSRALRRRREIGVRVALGAGRGRLARLLLMEALLLAAAGGAVAVIVAHAGGSLMRLALLPNVVWSTSPVSGRVLLFTGLVALLVGVVIGVVPAMQTNTRSVVGALRSGGRGGAPRSRLRQALTILQAALCVMLLVGAGLFVRSLSRVRAVDLGVQPDRLIEVSVQFPSRRALDSARRAESVARERRFYDDALDRVRSLPGVSRASVGVGSPFNSAFSIQLRASGHDSIPKLAGGGPYISAVSLDHFATLGTRFVQGRPFTAADVQGSELVTIVNETMARTLWPGVSPIGQCLFLGDWKNCGRVVGVVQDVQRFTLREEPAMQYYIPLGHEGTLGFGGRVLFVRAAGDPARLTETVRRALLPLSPEALDVSAKVMQDDLDPQIRPWRMGATMFGVFGLLALAMAAIGLFSVIAYSVSQRRQELGIRVALGAERGSIVRMILSQGVTLTAIGLTIGLLLSLWASRFVSELLFDTSPHDPAVFVVVVATLLATAVIASVVPAARAARVDPMEALRAE